MGTLTSVGGMLPLVLMPGAGSELYRGLGAVVTGGLVVSTLYLNLGAVLLASQAALTGRLHTAAPDDGDDANDDPIPCIRPCAQTVDAGQRNEVMASLALGTAWPCRAVDRLLAQHSCS